MKKITYMTGLFLVSTICGCTNFDKSDHLSSETLELHAAQHAKKMENPFWQYQAANNAEIEMRKNNAALENLKRQMTHHNTNYIKK